MTDLCIVKFWDDQEKLCSRSEVDLYAACEAMGIKVYPKHAQMIVRRLDLFVYPKEFMMALNAAQEYDKNGFQIMSYVEFSKAYLEFARCHVVPERLHVKPVVIAPEFTSRRIRI